MEDVFGDHEEVDLYDTGKLPHRYVEVIISATFLYLVANKIGFCRRPSSGSLLGDITIQNSSRLSMQAVLIAKHSSCWAFNTEI